MIRGVVLAILALMLWAYHAPFFWGQGLAFQVWPDSGGYLALARGIAGQTPLVHAGDRTIGYPAVVALALSTPRPALVLVAAQAVLAAMSFAVVYLGLTRLALPRLLADATDAQRTRARGAVGLGVAAATLYSVVHVQIAALLTETLFTALVLAAVLACIWLILPGRVVRRPWSEAAIVAAVVAVPVLVKPHWQLAAPVLGLVIGAALWRVVGGGMRWGAKRIVLTLLAFALPLAVMALVASPDRLLLSREAAPGATLFGPRTAFCNHAHLVHATLQRRPALTLDADPAFSADLGRHLARMVASHSTGWRLLGFNGDLCTYDSDFMALLDRRFPQPDAQRRFLLGSVLRAALADPAPYAGKVLAQVAHGFLSAFGRFAIHTRMDPEFVRAFAKAYSLEPGFAGGVRLAPEVGPLGAKARLDGTFAGRIVQGLLAVIFYAATAALTILAAVSVLLPALRWRKWSPDVKANFWALLALPLAALLGHHALIALVHSFDVWRYGFNMFYVNLFFIGTAAMFWSADRRRWRVRAG